MPRNEKTGTLRKYANEFAKSREVRIAICAGTREDELFDLRGRREIYIMKTRRGRYHKAKFIS